MKNKLLTVLNQCTYNKSIADFNVIIELINTINDDKTSVAPYAFFSTLL